MAISKTSTSKLIIRKVRHFSASFKEKVVKDLDSGLTSIKEVSTLYEVKQQTVYTWLYRYSIHHKKGSRMVVELESEGKKTEQLEKRVAELERFVGQKQLSIDYLEKLFAFASAHYQTDLKKNFATQSSTGIAPTGANTRTP
jgi:transposase